MLIQVCSEAEAKDETRYPRASWRRGRRRWGGQTSQQVWHLWQDSGKGGGASHCKAFLRKVWAEWCGGHMQKLLTGGSTGLPDGPATLLLMCWVISQKQHIETQAWHKCGGKSTVRNWALRQTGSGKQIGKWCIFVTTHLVLRTDQSSISIGLAWIVQSQGKLTIDAPIRKL